MPVNSQKSNTSDIDSDWSSSSRLSVLSSGSSWESRNSSCRSRSLTLDDESLKYLTREEKDVIQFLEETIDSLEDDFEEQVLCGTAPVTQSQEGSTPSDLEPEDVIDLVQPAPAAGEPACLPAVTGAAGAGAVQQEDIPVLECGTQDVETSPPLESTVPGTPPRPPSLPATTAPAHPGTELLSPSPPAEHPELPRSVPTPLVITKKISEKFVGNETLSPISPLKGCRSAEWDTLVSIPPQTGNNSVWNRYGIQPAPKIHRFPSNISVTNSAEKEFNKTISKAAVNVQERKAQVLANMNGVSFLSMGDKEDRAQKGDLPEQRSKPGPVQEAASMRAGGQASSQQSRGVQTEQIPPLANGFQSIHDVLKSEPCALFCTGKTVTICPGRALTSKLEYHSASKRLDEHWQLDCRQDVKKQSGSLPRAMEFRPQGITVQFAGRGSTEEVRREALRKLGLLKENL